MIFTTPRLAIKAKEAGFTGELCVPHSQELPEALENKLRNHEIETYDCATATSLPHGQSATIIIWPTESQNLKTIAEASGDIPYYVVPTQLNHIIAEALAGKRNLNSEPVAITAFIPEALIKDINRMQLKSTDQDQQQSLYNNAVFTTLFKPTNNGLIRSTIMEELNSEKPAQIHAL